MITKDIQPTIDKMMELLNPSTYVAHQEGHYLSGRPFEITKSDREFSFSSSCAVKKGVQTHKELEFGRNTIVQLRKQGQTLYAEGKYFFINKIKYTEAVGSIPDKLFSGSITSFCSHENHAVLNNKYLRMVIPNLKKKTFDLHDFQKGWINTPQNRTFQYFPVKVGDFEFHLIVYKTGDLNHVIIDSLGQLSLNEFQKICFNILLTYGFVSGDLIHDECFIFAYSSTEMVNSEAFLYHSMRSSVFTNQPTFTSNPFSVHNDVDFERNEDYSIKKEVVDKLNDGIILFPIDVFSKLTSLFYTQERLQRAALLFIQSHKCSLEMRLPNYCVAIEAITGYISSVVAVGSKSLSPIKDKKVAEELVNMVKTFAINLKSEKKLGDDDFNMTILEKNILKLNAPPNADKLSESFVTIGYSLSEEQKKVLRERNSFLHGSFLKTVDDDTAFREALHVALRLHFMIAVLLLKLADFNGKIINYAELWSHVTEKTLNEERLVKI